MTMNLADLKTLKLWSGWYDRAGPAAGQTARTLHQAGLTHTAQRSGGGSGDTPVTIGNTYSFKYEFLSEQHCMIFDLNDSILHSKSGRLFVFPGRTNFISI